MGSAQFEKFVVDYFIRVEDRLHCDPKPCSKSRSIPHPTDIGCLRDAAGRAAASHRRRAAGAVVAWAATAGSTERLPYRGVVRGSFPDRRPRRLNAVLTVRPNLSRK